MILFTVETISCGFSQSFPVLKEKIKPLLEEIISIPIDDEVQMTIKSISDIRDEAEYGGLGLSIDTLFDGIRTPLKIDITTGDKIIPKEITYKFHLMFEQRQQFPTSLGGGFPIEKAVSGKIQSPRMHGRAMKRSEMTSPA